MNKGKASIARCSLDSIEFLWQKVYYNVVNKEHSNEPRINDSKHMNEKEYNGQHMNEKEYYFPCQRKFCFAHLLVVINIFPNV